MTIDLVIPSGLQFLLVPVVAVLLIMGIRWVRRMFF